MNRPDSSVVRNGAQQRESAGYVDGFDWSAYPDLEDCPKATCRNCGRPIVWFRSFSNMEHWHHVESPQADRRQCVLYAAPDNDRQETA